MNQATRLKPLFHPSKLLVTPAAFTALRVNGIPVISVVLRYIAGDWGIVSNDDRQQNNLSLAAGLRLLSLYRLPNGNRIIVVTEWDRTNTTIERLDEVVVGSDARPAATGCTRHPTWPNAQYAQGDRA